MRANEYKILSDCVESGIQAGLRRAYKHLGPGEHPHPTTLVDTLADSVMLEISENFSFDSAPEVPPTPTE